MRSRIIEFVPGLLAGVLGGVAADWLLGYLLRRHGFWMPLIAGPLAGLACGQASPVASRPRGVLMAVFTLGLVVVIQWQLFSPPFDTDGTLLDYARHLHQLPALSLSAMVANVAVAYYWGREQGIQFARRGLALRVGPSAKGVQPPEV